MGLLDKVKEATGFEKQTIVKGAFVGIALFVFFGIGQAILTTLLGVAYPVFMSFHALENDDVNKNDDKQWLTYWVVFGLFNIIDQFAGFVLHFIPFYYVLKLGVLIFLFHPKSVGATWVYNNYIQEYAGEITKIDDATK
jgi:receptor expression-enhancing protein 5/6